MSKAPVRRRVSLTGRGKTEEKRNVGPAPTPMPGHSSQVTQMVKEPSIKTVFNIREFELEKMRSNSKTIIVGRPGTGKSTLMSNIIRVSEKDFSTAVILSGSEDNNNFYSKIFPSLFIFHEYNEEVMNKIAQRQKLM